MALYRERKGDAMGARQSNEKYGSGNKKTRGTVNNASRLDAFSGGDKGSLADWSSCDPAGVLGVIHKITQLGGAVIFGLSRDGGAHSVTLMLDDKRETLWYNGDADLSEAMEAVSIILDDIAITS